jgi:23S rRNA (pseudouridine1915-N3)-methyltransferase
MKIRIFVVGAKIGANYRSGFAEYRKRLTKICQLELATFTESAAELKSLRDQKAARDYWIAVVPGGSPCSSEGLAEKMRDWALAGHQSLIFLVGLTRPADSVILEATDEMITLSPLAMPAELSMLLLSEQIYRAFRINENQPYHK